MQPIPLPEVLNPDRLLLDDRNDLSAEQHADRAAQLNHALHETCSYAQQLWHELDAARGYLLHSLPPDPRTVDPATAADQPSSAAPTGPDDEQGWQNWIGAYAQVTSVLAGPHLDSGFGVDEARREARDRRLVPPPAQSADLREEAAEPPAASATAVAAASPSSRHGGGGSSKLRLALRLAIIALAVRGLRRPAG
jgi:hypothetical protein